MDTLRCLPLMRLLVSLSLVLIFIPQGLAQTAGSYFPAIFVFGDSTVDAGNNNFIPLTFSKCNFPPYGKDFYNSISSGRWTNGKVIADFMAQHFRIKDTIPPFFDPSLTVNDLITGVNFASGGSGYDPLTSIVTASIAMDLQLINFGIYKRRLQAAVGNERAEDIISRALYVVSAGSNDVGGRSITVPLPLLPLVGPILNTALMLNVRRFYQGMWNMGARKFAVFGVISIGCVPSVINRFLSPNRMCVSPVTAYATNFNNQLQNLLATMESSLEGAKFTYLDFHGALYEMIQNPSKYGFENVDSPCCLAIAVFCAPLTWTCPDRSKFIFWDLVHPTQAAYATAFSLLQPTIDSLIHM